MVQYRTHTTETVHYLADYLDGFHATKDAFTTYRTSKATDSIAHAHMKDLKMQHEAKPAIADEERAKCREGLSHTEKEHQKAEVKMHLQEVYNSTVHDCTSFNFIKIYIMVHYEESVQRFGHLVKDSTKTQEINHSKLCMGSYHRSNRNFQYESQILNDLLCIHILR